MNHYSYLPEETILFLTDQTSPIMEEIEGAFGTSTYSLVSCPSESELFQAFDRGRIVVIHDQPEIEALIQKIRNKNPDISIVLITDDASLLNHPLETIDLVLPETPLVIVQQLTFMLKILSRNHQLTHQNITLREEVDNLNQALEAEKRSRNEIEILKNAIVRNVSHELKTPLLHVKSAVSLIAEDVGKENNLIKYAENATARLETLITNITMFGSSLDLNLGPVILRDAVEYARRNLGRIWQHKSDTKRIELYIDKDLPPVLADKQGLSTILQLLLDNALKFSTEHIEVHAHLKDEAIEISVVDYGIGIAPDHLTTIFDSFYQVDSSSTRRYGGTGVGLALVKLLLEHHDSKIKVESKLKKGSTFSFQLKIVNLH